ncbi:MAG: GNAT family N-acetyltransferase [Acidobacteria bacterium]|nr:GNAT family N-acetyltransferase [Acidobacteriota bacterium]
MSSIYLLEEFQRAGIGGRLFRAVAEELMKRGYRSLSICVLAANSSRKFYERLGGRVIRESVAKIDGAEYPDAFHGWDDISLILTA